METLFFLASKTLGAIARVETWALILMALALFGLWRGRRRLALSLNDRLGTLDYRLTGK